MRSVAGSQFAGLNYEGGKRRRKGGEKYGIAEKPARAKKHPRMLTQSNPPFKESGNWGPAAAEIIGRIYDSSRLRWVGRRAWGEAAYRINYMHIRGRIDTRP